MAVETESTKAPNGSLAGDLTDEERTRRSALEEAFGEAAWQLRAAGFNPYR